MRTFEILEHTADVGLKVYGTSPPTLFINALTGFYELITDYSHLTRCGDKQKKIQAVSIKLDAENLEELFLKWMRELLYLFSAKQLILVNVVLKELGPERLIAEGGAQIYCPKQQEQRYEIKAVTYHSFSLQKKHEGYEAQVILDI